MPSDPEHHAKYLANRAYLNAHAGQDPCWDATVAFYAAVHLVERLAALQGIDHRRHTGPNSRNLYLTNHPQHHVILSEFTALYDASLAARYDALADFQAAYPGDVVRRQLIDVCLVAIENYVNHTAPVAPPP